jgi:PII-like signaling protein
VKLEGEQVLLRMHLSNFAHWHTGPLYEALVEKARKEHLAGATVLSGVYGYVDRAGILGEHPHALPGHHVLVTLERAHVVHYRGGEKRAAG